MECVVQWSVPDCPCIDVVVASRQKTYTVQRFKKEKPILFFLLFVILVSVYLVDFVNNCTILISTFVHTLCVRCTFVCCSSTLLISYFILNLMDECQRFFTALSVLPGNNLDISAHRFPNFSWSEIITMSSSEVQLFLLTCGLNWLCHLSRHCFAFRDFIDVATLPQFEGPGQK